MPKRVFAQNIAEDPLWYKDAVIYEVYVRSFRDSNGDGTGDFRGLIEKLDYIQDLGVTALWVLPFYPSPLRDGGYDIADYRGVKPEYGTLRDVKQFIDEAHRRGIRVIFELVANHTSDQHPWFQRARRAKPGSVWRDFYVWSDTPDKYREARIIFKDFETSNWAWDPVARAYYWHRFYSHQPDLNYDNPRVQQEMIKVVDYWLDMGVDGLRLDAVPYLYEREGTNCENVPETHEFLKKLRRHIDEKYGNRMLLAEANQWPEDAVAYFGEGDECHMAFHFPLMPRLFMAIHQEDRFPITDILERTPSIPDNAQWCVFLRNHDELTLEMLTDEERDYMYRVYAEDPQMRINLGIRRRLAPLMRNNRRRIELMNALLFSIIGAPVIYYGDEIGMGDNIYLGDRDGVRTPMQWSSDRNAGFSEGNEQRLFLPVIVDPEYHYQAVNVAVQQKNPQSLLNWMKQLIALRKQSKAFSRGSLEVLQPNNHRVLAFLRRWQDETILVVANLSRFVQSVKLDLASFRGCELVEMFGGSTLPPIGEEPYFITLGPHGFYWFQVAAPRPVTLVERSRRDRIPTLQVRSRMAELLERSSPQVGAADAIMPYLLTHHWFGRRPLALQSVQFQDAVRLPKEQGNDAYLAIARLNPREGDAETCAVPLGIAQGEAAADWQERQPAAEIARVVANETGDRGLIYDGLADPAIRKALLETVLRERRLRGMHGELDGTLTRLGRRRVSRTAVEESRLVFVDARHREVIYDDRLALKLIGRPDVGLHPEVEIAPRLQESGFRGLVPVLGWIDYCQSDSEPMTIAVLRDYLPGASDLWEILRRQVAALYRSPDAAAIETLGRTTPARLRLDDLGRSLPPSVPTAFAPIVELVRLAGRRTVELHVALARLGDDPAVAPEPFTEHYQEALFYGMLSAAERTFWRIRQLVAEAGSATSAALLDLLAHHRELHRFFRPIKDHRIDALRIRCHGDLRLGSFLKVGDDLVLGDFEGEFQRPLSERRIKRSPIRDVASMLASLHNLSYAALADPEADEPFGEAAALREPLARFTHHWLQLAFLQEYVPTATRHGLVPSDPTRLQILIDTFLLERSMTDLRNTLRNHPDRVSVPARSILDVLTG
ncbi:MAG: maltose alpha-D-glucosyltransferase [Chloroflexota bacterium]|nr:maltose alpha-D-glucosyltransferase [Dehalococcoidia bacterium]MDW8252780.1 maltose alpha-D-glucosyltransferase [Chloroflexota bacterium]